MSTLPPAPGGGLRLRPPQAADDAFLAHLREPAVAGELNWFGGDGDGPVARPADVSRLIVILENGTPVGAVSWFGTPYGPNPRSLAWKIGITILPEHRGYGHGARAQRVLAEHLFASTAANRVEADTDVANVAEQRALERAGFVREGVLRGAQHRGTRWHDLVLYARLRDDPRHDGNGPITGIDHVQLAMPPGGEDAARAFYTGLLGLPETPKPPTLARRGGCWFETSLVKLHLGVERDFRPARKAHPALLVSDVFALVATLIAADVEVVDDEPLPGYHRVYTSDPFGNRLELLERIRGGRPAPGPARPPSTGRPSPPPPPATRA